MLKPVLLKDTYIHMIVSIFYKFLKFLIGV